MDCILKRTDIALIDDGVLNRTDIAVYEARNSTDIALYEARNRTDIALYEACWTDALIDDAALSQSGIVSFMWNWILVNVISIPLVACSCVWKTYLFLFDFWKFTTCMALWGLVPYVGVRASVYLLGFRSDGIKRGSVASFLHTRQSIIIPESLFSFLQHEAAMGLTYHTSNILLSSGAAYYVITQIVDIYTSKPDICLCPPPGYASIPTCPQTGCSIF